MRTRKRKKAILKEGAIKKRRLKLFREKRE